jgi:XTP/dITP diphosphohydrolase
MKTAILASGNVHKLEEIYAILKDFDYNLISMEDAGFGDLDIIEDGDTFEANSLIKAKVLFEKTGKPSIGDDSGLEVDYLNGAPGVFSARYAGEGKNDKDNNDKLLKELSGVSDEKRTARFVTVITMITEDGKILAARGTVEGKIGNEEKGDNGFGYDPLFIPSGMDKSFAELSSLEKNAMSHRANALKKLKEML